MTDDIQTCEQLPGRVLCGRSKGLQGFVTRQLRLMAAGGSHGGEAPAIKNETKTSGRKGRSGGHGAVIKVVDTDLPRDSFFVRHLEQ